MDRNDGPVMALFIPVFFFFFLPVQSDFVAQSVCHQKLVY